MSTTNTVQLPEGREIRVTIERGNSVGFPASSILFDADANVIGETSTTTYNGYCTHEIVQLEALALRVSGDDLDTLMSECECYFDDETF